MPATAAQIGFVGSQFRTVTASDAAIKTRYGAAARDTLENRVETFFDSTLDAQAVVDERFALLKSDRRMFQVGVVGIMAFTGGLAFTSTVPAATLIDTEKSANLPVAIFGPSLNFENETTTLTVWG